MFLIVRSLNVSKPDNLVAGTITCYKIRLAIAVHVHLEEPQAAVPAVRIGITRGGCSGVRKATAIREHNNYVPGGITSYQITLAITIHIHLEKAKTTVPATGIREISRGLSRILTQNHITEQAR